MLSRGFASTAGPLATLDPGSFTNGFYRLRLSASDLSGRSSVAEALIEINSAVKSAAYQRLDRDLSVILNGERFDFGRVYDSLQRDAAGDFGFGGALLGWNSTIQTDVPATGRESLGRYNPLRIGSRLYVTLPD